ncbi:MAG: glycosyl transferase family 2 [Chitinophagaceae bacterium]|nr:glycosyl transferase family 2 [Chitinophagaceae bacterium]
MNRESKITVVIALFNKAAYVEKCIASVLAQSMGSFSLIVVDDGSSDGSPKLVEQFNDERLQLISINNSGPGVARNIGLKRSDTEYIAFLDADDHWHIDFLKTALHALERHPACDLWLCGASWEPLGERREPCLTREKKTYQDGPWNLETNYTAEETYEALNLFATGAVVAKTSVIKKYKGYFDRKRCTSGEDGYLWLQVMYNHQIYRERSLLLFINTTGSDLGIGRRSLKPIPPWLLYPQPIIAQCPSVYRKSLHSFFELTAFMAFRREVYQGKLVHGLRLWWHYPGLSKYRANYALIAYALLWYPFKHYVRLFLKRNK